MRRTLLVLGAVALVALLAACPAPTSSDDDDTINENRVVALVSGVVTDSVTNAGIQGVTVTIAGPSTRTTTTNIGGIYSFNDVVHGDYVITFSANGYSFGQTTIAVDDTTYLDNDPYYEQALIDLELAVAQAMADGQTFPASQWTYDEGSQMFNFGDGDNAITIEAEFTDDGVLELTNDQLLEGTYTYAATASNVTLSPLSAGLSGRIWVEFTPGDVDVVPEERRAAIISGVTVLAIDLDTNDDGVVDALDGPPRTYATATTTATGEFQLDNLPASQTLVLQITPFEQDYTPSESTDAWTYYFAGAQAQYGSDSFDGDSANLTMGEFTTIHEETQEIVPDIVLRPLDDQARVVAHNVGSVGTPLVVDRMATEGNAIELTFSKSIDPETFGASVDISGDALAVGESNTSTIELEPTWVADSNFTRVSLLPVNEVANNNGYLPYDLTAGKLVFDTGIRAADGGSFLYDVDGDGGVDDDDRLSVFTEQGLRVIRIDFLDANGTTILDTVALYDPDNDFFYDLDTARGSVPPGGSIQLTFNKDIVESSVEAEFFDGDQSTALDDAENGEIALPANKVTFSVPADTPATGESRVLTVPIPPQIDPAATYTLAVYVESTAPQDRYNSDLAPNGSGNDNIVFDYDTRMQPIEFTQETFTNVATNILVGDGLTSGGATNNITTTYTTDFLTGESAPLLIEFTKEIDIANTTVALYYWDESGSTVNEIEAGELATSATPATVTAVDDAVRPGTQNTVLSIQPQGILAPAKKFAIAMSVQATDGDVFRTSPVADFGEDDVPYIVFQVDTVANTGLILPADPAAYGTLNGAVANLVVDQIPGTPGLDPVDVIDTTVTVIFDTREDSALFGETGLYTLYRRSSDPTNGEYVQRASADELTFIGSFFDSDQTATDDLDDGAGDDDVVDPFGAFSLNPLFDQVNGSLTYVVTAWTPTGIAVFSDEVVVNSDGEDPTVTPAPAAFNAAALTTAGLTDLAVGPPTAFENQTGNPITFTVNYTLSEPVTVGDVLVTETFADAAVTVTRTDTVLSDGGETFDAYLAAIQLVVTVPDGATITAGEQLSLQVSDIASNSTLTTVPFGN